MTLPGRRAAPREIRIAAPARVPDRAARLPRIEGVDARERLARLRVLIVGAGSVGRVVVGHLARLGLGELGVVDRGRFKPESLLTHPVGPEELGLSKAASAGRMAKAVSPASRVLVWDGELQDVDLAWIARADACVLATDNLAAEVLLGERCLNLGRPLWQAAVHGETLVAQVRAFGNASPAAPCPGCAFGQLEWDLAAREVAFSCQGPGPGTAPTRSPSFLCSLAADLVAAEIFAHALGREPARADVVVEHCAYSRRTVVSALRRNPACPCEHEHWSTVRLGARIEDATLGEILRAGGVELPAGLGTASLSFPGLAWSAHADCACATPPARFVRLSAAGPACSACGAALPADPHHVHREVPARELSTSLARTAGDLGADGVLHALVRTAEGARLVLAAAPAEQEVCLEESA